MGQLYISLAIILILSTSLTVAKIQCPLLCKCTIVDEDGGSYNHAKCTSLAGLKTLDRTNDIHSLDLSNIGLTRISNQLAKLTNLSRIDLSNNRLAAPVRLTRRIQTINLSNNRITSGKLMKISSYVVHLNLSHNEITYLPLELKRKFSRLETIQLSNNPLNCTCDTIQMRNWLSSKLRDVYSDQSIECTNPVEYKDRSWLEVGKSEVCDHTVNVDELRDESIDENDLMFGDEPAYGLESAEGDEYDEGLEKDFLPVSASTKSGNGGLVLDQLVEEDENGSGVAIFSSTEATAGKQMLFEGSADELLAKRLNFVTNEGTTEPPLYDDDEDDYYDGSGSGDDLMIPIVRLETNETDDEETSAISELPETISFTSISLGIFNDGQPLDSESTTATATPVHEEVIIAATASNIDTGRGRLAPVIAAPDPDKGITVAPLESGENDVKAASPVEESNIFSILLILGILLVTLLVLVAILRRRNRRRRHAINGGKDDPENPTGTELQDMDNKKLGKPLHGNGNTEISPLVPNRDKWEGRPANGGKAISSAEEPLLKRLDEPEMESEVTQKSNVEPEPEPEKESIETKPKRESYHPNETNNNIQLPEQITQPESNSNIQVNGIPRDESIQNGIPDDDDNVFVPIAPQPTRYSPVYSPITGRVKIKLTETPKPRTPILVTRSRSNAGDIITTPHLRPPPTNLQ